jgi:hypothetical protein
MSRGGSASKALRFQGKKPRGREKKKGSPCGKAVEKLWKSCGKAVEKLWILGKLQALEQ